MASRRTRRTRQNPPLAVFANPPHGGRLLSDRAYGLEYRHAGDGKDYRHDFATGVRIECMGDGSVRLYRMDRKPVWEEF